MSGAPEPPAAQDPEAPPTYEHLTATQLATAAEENLRGIVHLAEGARPLDAATVYGVLSALTRMLDHVPEVVSRMRAVVVRQQERGTLSIAAGRFTGDPQAATAALNAAIDEVLAGLGPVRMHAGNAQAAVAEAEFVDADPERIG